MQQREQNIAPHVEGLILTDWYRVFEKEGTAATRMWTMYHVKYADTHRDKLTLYARCPEGTTLAQSHQEKGLNYAKSKGPDFPLLARWDPDLVALPDDPLVLDWGGEVVQGKGKAGGSAPSPNHFRHAASKMDATVIATMATNQSARDVQLFLFSLQLFNPVPPTVYLLCDSDLQAFLPPYRGLLHVKPSLDKYKKDSRSSMTKIPGTVAHTTLWDEFMMEKVSAMEWAFADGAKDVFYIDSDVMFLGPVLKPPVAAKLALSAHGIKPSDEKRYGIYNGGFLWSSDARFPARWKEAYPKSKLTFGRDQTCLENIAAATPAQDVFVFPAQTNFGWWRMFQSTESVASIQSKWTVCGGDAWKSAFKVKFFNFSGICFSGQPLLSVHTHFSGGQEWPTPQFNRLVHTLLKGKAVSPESLELAAFIAKTFPEGKYAQL